MNLNWNSTDPQPEDDSLTIFVHKGPSLAHRICKPSELTDEQRDFFTHSIRLLDVLSTVFTERTLEDRVAELEQKLSQIS